MRRIARYALDAVTVLSLLLCVATILLWMFTGVQPVARTSSVDIAHASFVDIDHGRVRWARQRLVRPDPPRRLGYVLDVRTRRTVTVRDGTGVLTTVTDPKPRDVPNYLWFHEETSDFATSFRSPYSAVVMRVSVVCVPLWFPTVIFALPGAVRALARARIRRARWLRAGRCLGCGYDLRATPDRCPECGAVSAASRG